MLDEIEYLEENSATAAARDPWVVLIVDDEPLLHESTRLAMSGFQFDGRGLEFISCYSAAEGYRVLAERRDIALILLDVVMETDSAGLDLARMIREEIRNTRVRIVLRTGQPGQAPEEHVIQHYDINDYKDKTELTRSKLVTTFYAALRAYRDLMRLDRAAHGLRRTVFAIREVYEARHLHTFASAVLTQVHYLLNIQSDGVYAGRTAVYAARSDGAEHIHVLTLAAEPREGRLANDVSQLPPEVRMAIEGAFRGKRGQFDKRCLVSYQRTSQGTESVLYIAFAAPIGEDALDLLQLFSASVISTYENLLLRDEVEETQRSTICLLGEALEKRSSETGAHVRRVSEIAALLARAVGLDERTIEDIAQAAPLHDIGKVGIPDRVLNKPGKLEAEEWDIMRTHAVLGHEILVKSPKRVLQLAAVIALQHHERWDGGGYPQALAGDAIHIAGRIVALADVFDALVSRRCYKDAWGMREAIDHAIAERGGHFDPRLVDALLFERAALDDIYKRYPDDWCQVADVGQRMPPATWPPVPKG